VPDRTARREATLLWAALYLVVGLTFAVVQPDNGQSAWYPPVAIGVAMLLTLGWWVLPVILACEVVVSLVQYDFHPAGAPISAVVTVGEAALFVALLRLFRFRPTFERADDVVIMGVAAAAATLAGGTLGAALLTATGAIDAPFRHEWEVWVTGDLTGLVLTLPLLLLVVAHPGASRPRLTRTHGSATEQVVVMGASIALVVGYFIEMDPHTFHVAKSGPLLLVLLPTFWVPVRFGLGRTSAYIVAMTTTAIISYAGLGPHLVHGGRNPRSSLDMVTLMLPMLVVGMAAIGVAAAIEAQERARTRERTIVDASPVGIITIDSDGIVRSWSSAAERILGIDCDDVIGTAPPVLHGLTVASTSQPATVAAGQAVHIIRHTRVEGTVAVVKVFTSPLVDDDIRFAGTVAVLEDITEQEALAQRQVLLSTAIEQASESIIVTDPTPAIIYANPAAQLSSGYSLAEMIGRNPNIFQSGFHDSTFYQELWATVLDGGAWHGTLINKRKNGELFEEEVNIAPVLDVDHKLVAFVGVKHDLTRERALEADVRASRRDRAIVQSIIEQVRADGSVHSIANTLCAKVVEITDFDAATLLLVQSDGSLLPGGLAGAAFDGASDVVMAPEVGAKALVALTERGSWYHDWTQPLEPNDPWTERFRSSGITATAYAPVRWENDLFGVLLVASVASDGTELMRRHLGVLSELASFAGVIVGSKVEQDRNRAEVRAEIREVIERRLFRSVFQPYIDLETGELRGYEALTRFTDGVPPDRKVREAWLVGMGPALEAAVARAALEVADRRLPGVQISLNFSPDTVLDGLAAVIVRSARRPLVIEVTEHMAIEDYPALRTALKACGDVKVSIDDAGAGFAGLRHILELEPDVVKLDIGLIRGIDTDLARQALTAGMSHYAAATTTLLIAEGIETAEEAETVRRLGVHYAQGFYFGRPELVE
jgi:PAS domain S-box-containing protein